MLSRQGFLRDQKCNTGFKIDPPLLKNLRCAGVSSFNQLPHGEVDLPPCRFGGADYHVLYRGQEGLGPGCIGALPRCCIHSVFCDHLDRDFSRPLQVTLAREKILASQRPFLDRLETLSNSRRDRRKT